MTLWSSGSAPPLEDGEVHLQPRHQEARRLLEAARRGDLGAGRRLRTASAAPSLRDARNVIARDLGFDDWPAFEHHAGQLEAARHAASIGLDSDRETVHLRCGSDIREGLRRAGLNGHFQTFTDPFCIGPVSPQPRDQQIEQRSAFLGEAFAMDADQARQREQREYDELDRALDSPRLVLWFEHDSYDQLILAYLLHYLGTRRVSARVELVAVDAVPGVRRFVGLGQLAPEVLGWLWRQRRPVDGALLALGRQAWRAITADTPERLDRLSQRVTPELPMLGRALRRHLLELPDEDTGLGLSEQLAMQLVAERGPIRAGEVFSALIHEREPLPYLGSDMFWWVLRPLLGGQRPILHCHDEDGEWAQRRLSVTDFGHRVLSGHDNWLDTRPPRRWVGGVAIDGDRDSWCLNKATGRPRPRQAAA